MQMWKCANTNERMWKCADVQMNVNKFHYYLFIVFLLLVVPVHATKTSLIAKIDTSSVDYKPVSVVKLSHYRQSSDFQYMDKQPIVSGFWKALRYKIRQILRSLFSGSISRPLIHLLTILLVTSAIIILIMLILTLFGIDIQAILVRSKKLKNPVDSIQESNSLGFDFDVLAQHEIDAGNYHLAIRYLYLKLLQILANQHLISWQRDKTNRDYINELLNTSYINEFKIITLDYEFIWYGKFQCNRFSFENIHSQFKQLYQLLNA